MVDITKDPLRRGRGDPDVLQRDVMRAKARLGEDMGRGTGGRATPMQAFGAMRDSPCCGGTILIILLLLLAILL